MWGGYMHGADRIEAVLRLLPVLVLTACLLPAADTIAVLPLFNHSNAANLDWIGESAAETIRESLSSDGDLVLRREDRVEVFRRLSIRPNALLTKASVLKVGEELDAGQVVFGEFEVKTGANKERTIRLIARMIDLKKMREGAEFEQTGPLEDLSLLETKLAWNFVHVFGPKSTVTEEEFLRLRPPVRIDAVELYMRGLISGSADQKQKLFTQAATLNEHFSQPAFQLGRIYWEKKDYKQASHWLERVTPADSHYLEGLYLLGLCAYHQGDYLEAIKQFQAVAGEMPLNEVFNDLGAAQSRRNLADAEDNFKKALEGDASDADYWFNMGYWQWKNGVFYAAADKFRAVLDRSPSDTEATSFLGRCLRKEGPRTGDAKTEGRERLKVSFEDTAFRQLQAEMKKK
jgi:tetratricopeptide (TPR) repeat protein